MALQHVLCSGGVATVLLTALLTTTPAVSETVASDGATKRITTASTAQADTYVARSLNRKVGSKRRLEVQGPRGYGLISFPTPELGEDAEAVAASVCVTPVRTMRTRLAVFSAPSGWDEGTTWATRPRLEQKRLGVSSRSLRAGRRICIGIRVSALEPGATEVRLRAVRRGARVVVRSSESMVSKASLRVAWRKGGGKGGSGTTTPPPTLPPAGDVLWDGGFDTGGLPHGANGPSCGTGELDGPDSERDQYTSIEQYGNTNCDDQVSLVNTLTRTPDSARSLKIVMAPGQQREQPQSRFTWIPDDKGSVDQWYGFSFYYADDWNLGGGLLKEVSGTNWHNPVAFRMDGDNGSLNVSGDMDLNNANGQSYVKFSEPHLVLRRNTVQNGKGFYTDGAGLDKLDLGPLVTNQWMDVVCHIRWSTTATNALRECWRDGLHMGTRTTLNAVAPVTHRLRVGQYQTTSIGHPRTSYMDNVRIGTSYAAVDPSVTRS